MNINNYTNNLKEKVRIDIGRMLICHELIKLLPDLDYEDFKTQINWMETDLSNIVAVRDFWNLVDSLMMGYKLKDLIYLLTSSQINWNLASLKFDNLRFTSNISEIEGFNITGKTVGEISSYLLENTDILEKVRIKNQAAFAVAGSRANDPVIVEEHTDGTLHVHDGNGRLLKAMIEEQDSINAYVGTHNDVSRSNHWVPTSYLMRLSDNQQRELLVEILKESDNAIFEFKNRVYSEEDFKQEIFNALNDKGSG